MIIKEKNSDKRVNENHPLNGWFLTEAKRGAFMTAYLRAHRTA